MQNPGNVSGVSPPGGRFDRGGTVASRTNSNRYAPPAGRTNISNRGPAANGSTEPGKFEPPSSNIRSRRPRPKSPEESTTPPGDQGNGVRPRADLQASAPRPAASPAQLISRRGSVNPVAGKTEFVEVGRQQPAPGSMLRRTTAALPAMSLRYGYDPDYRWLRGQLEQMQSTGQWKLRYVPINGETDEFGGSVEIVDSPLLRNYKPGDFVSVEGELTGEGGDRAGFAPRYRVARVERLPGSSGLR